MKRNAIIRISGIAIILSLLFLLIPVLPAYAVNAYTISLSPTSGAIGTTVTITGSDFLYSAAVEHFVTIYFSSQDVNITALKLINTQVTTYKMVKDGIYIMEDDSDSGHFSTTFTVPTTMTDGDVDANVAAGTYYVYVIETPDDATSYNYAIKAKASFTVSGSASLAAPDPSFGPAGTPNVLITGSSFTANATLYFKFDTANITPTSGRTTTLPTGDFYSFITIPSTAAAGLHTIYVTAGTSTANTTFNVTLPAALGPLQPVSGLPGTSVAISGTNFPANTLIVFKFDTTTLTPTGTLTGSGGDFARIITIPSNAIAGDHIITVTVGAIERTATFNVTGTPTTTPPTTTPPTTTPPTTTPPTTTPPTTTPPTTTPPTPTATVPIIIDQSGDTIGSTISIAGSGFLPDHAITVTFDNVTIKEAKTNASGGFVSNFLVPPNSQHGDHTITATDGTHIGTATYKVESTAPGTPLPLLPAMGEAIPAPASFDWSDVDDASKPVTYNLQIATSANFSPDAILINKTAIAKSEYTLTEAEQLKLNSQVTYYWREQAVDAALNNSSWTGAGEFTMIKPFEFTGWPLYLTIGVGGLILFLLGLWVGRRSAFYY